MNKRTIDVQIGSEIYTFKKPNLSVELYELEDLLAEKIYESIRDTENDVFKIADNVDFTLTQVRQIKDHVFYKNHYLDRYDEVEYKRFDPNLKQALAWKRCVAGVHNQYDMTWLKHEFVEQDYETKNNATYKPSHLFAQNLYNGDPWPKE